MGRRKKATKPQQKSKVMQPLDTEFNCPFCNHEKSCDVQLDRICNTASIVCNICLENFRCRINYLSEALDVYNEWVDACEGANR